MVQKFSSVFCFFVVLFLNSETHNFSGRSYYFKTNGNNEFTVYNRIHFLNHNISDFDANPHPPQNIKFNKQVAGSSVGVVKNNHMNQNISSKLYLDEEWNYEHSPVNKSDLPFFIKKIYEHRVKEGNKTNTVRILFNENKNSSSKIIKFNLDSLAPDENITDADMYFYWPLENTSSIYKASVVLRLYQFENEFGNELNESNLVENPDIHKLFNVIYISKAQKGWQTFKIKKPMDNWANGDQNLGLLLTISDYDENKLISIYNDTNDGVFRTFAVVNIQGTAIHPIVDTISDSDSLPLITTTNYSLLSYKCSKKPWQVDFHHIHWDKFILYPEDGFMAYHCHGKCYFKTDEDDMINHVKLRQFSNGHTYKEKSCCVPTEFLSLPIMFFDKYGNVVLKHYDNMVVKSCGCR